MFRVLTVTEKVPRELSKPLRAMGWLGFVDVQLAVLLFECTNVSGPYVLEKCDESSVEDGGNAHEFSVECQCVVV
jgi:hypothetical protein